MRPLHSLIAGSIALLLSLVTPACGGAPDGTDDVGESDDALSPSEAQGRADLATTRLIQRFWSHDYLEEGFPNDGKNAGYWIYAQAFDAVLDGVERTHGAKFKGDVARFFDAQARRGFRRDFFDDENWMALALIRAHDLTGERRYLDKAEELVADIMQTGWEDGKGIWWDRAHSSRATASNFGPVIAATRLFTRTHHAEYRTFAMKAYGFWYAHMVDRTTHQVADHEQRDGKVLWWKFTYNEGLAIGASTALYGITQDSRYLDHAEGFAAFMISHEVTVTRFGDVLFDGAGCSGDCDAFKGIGYRYLLGLYEIDRTHTEYAKVLQASADAVWGIARSPKSTTFSSDWAGPSARKTSLAADASAVMALNLGVTFER